MDILIKTGFSAASFIQRTSGKSLSAFLRWGAGKETDVFGSREGKGRRWVVPWRMEGGASSTQNTNVFLLSERSSSSPLGSAG